MSQNPDPNDVVNGTPEQSEKTLKKEAILRTILEPDARSRLGNIRMVKPELATNIENYLFGLASQGRAPSLITDSQLKQILVSLQQPKRDFKFNRV